MEENKFKQIIVEVYPLNKSKETFIHSDISVDYPKVEDLIKVLATVENNYGSGSKVNIKVIELNSL